LDSAIIAPAWNDHKSATHVVPQHRSGSQSPGNALRGWPFIRYGMWIVDYLEFDATPGDNKKSIKITKARRSTGWNSRNWGRKDKVVDVWLGSGRRWNPEVVEVNSLPGYGQQKLFGIVSD
jgi:hypothetical protein